jgi:hypothetical protein
MERFGVMRCVIDGLPETHATRAFAERHRGWVYLNFFNETQRGEARWDQQTRIVQVNRTEALDASRAAIREKAVTLPRRSPLLETFARHMAADAKVLDEDPESPDIPATQTIRKHLNSLETTLVEAGRRFAGRKDDDVR